MAGKKRGIMKNYKRIFDNADRNKRIEKLLRRKFGTKKIDVYADSNWNNKDYISVFINFRYQKKTTRVFTKISTDYPRMADFSALDVEGAIVKSKPELIRALTFANSQS